MLFCLRTATAGTLLHSELQSEIIEEGGMTEIYLVTFSQIMPDFFLPEPLRNTSQQFC